MAGHLMLHGSPCSVAWQVIKLVLPCNQAVALMLSAAVFSILSSTLGTTVNPAFSQISWHNIIDSCDVHWHP